MPTGQHARARRRDARERARSISQRRSGHIAGGSAHIADGVPSCGLLPHSSGHNGVVPVDVPVSPTDGGVQRHLGPMEEYAAGNSRNVRARHFFPVSPPNMQEAGEDLPSRLFLRQIDMGSYTYTTPSSVFNAVKDIRL